jgi:hypothetical protein
MAVGRSSGSWRRLAWTVGLASSIFIGAGVSIPQSAWGIKWPNGCPEMRPGLTDAGSRIFTSAPFVHPGHEIGYFLEEREASRRGGFSVEPDGNTVQITFKPPGGRRIKLAPITATAVSATALYFPFPDTRLLLGRMVVGPMEVRIRSGRITRRARQPVALPPGNDVLALLEQGVGTPALGAMDMAHRLWIPLDFAGFGSGEPMPGCPIELTRKVAFAVGLSIKGVDSDEVIPHASSTNFRRGKLYFGDFLLNGENAYGEDTLSSLDIRTLKGGGVVICGMNDALSLVLMLRLKESALGPRSLILPVVRDGSPLPVELTNISGEPVVADQLRTVTRDSFGNECVAVP